MTANAMAVDRAKALAAGMNEHLSKPIDPSELYAAIKRWFKRPSTISHRPAVRPLRDSPTEAPIERLDGVDVADGLKRVAGNRALYRNLLLKFRGSQQRAAEEIRAALAADDRERAVRVAHTVRGVAGSIGARELQAAAASMEAHLSNANSAQPVDLTAFENALHRVVSSIANLEVVAAESPRSGPMPDIAAIVEKLAHLESLLKDDDFDARNVVEELLPHFQGSRHAGLFEALRRKVIELRFRRRPG